MLVSSGLCSELSGCGAEGPEFSQPKGTAGQHLTLQYYSPGIYLRTQTQTTTNTLTNSFPDFETIVWRAESFQSKFERVG